MPSLSPTAKKLLSIAFLAALVFGGARLFQIESAETEIHVKFRGDGREAFRSVELRLHEPGELEVLGHFRSYRQKLSGESLGRWELTIAAGRYELEGEVELSSGVRMVRTDVDLEDGESHSVYLDELLR